MAAEMSFMTHTQKSHAIISATFGSLEVSHSGTSLVVQRLRFRLLVQGVWVRSPVGELRSHMPQGKKRQDIKQKQYCNKFNKDFKNGLHQKKIFKKKRSVT